MSQASEPTAGPTAAEAVLFAAERSPQLVAAHDRAGWLAMFAFPGEVEDPVGGLPCRRRPGGDDQVGPFWDTFIAPNTIRFEVHRDIVADGVAVRDLTIHTTLSTGLQIAVPAYVTYAMTAESDGLRLRRLAAYWEIGPMVLHIAGRGLAGLSTMLRMTGRILRFQGLRGLAAYTRAMLSGVRRARGQALVEAFARTFHAASPDAKNRLLNDCAGPRPEGLGTDARLAVGKVICAGRMVVFRMALRDGDRAWSGIAFLRTGLSGIQSARFYFKQ